MTEIGYLLTKLVFLSALSPQLDFISKLFLKLGENTWLMSGLTGPRIVSGSEVSYSGLVQEIKDNE